MASTLAAPAIDPAGLWRWWLQELRALVPLPARRASVRPDAVLVLYERGSARVAVRRRRGLEKLGTVRLESGRDEGGGVVGEPLPASIMRAVRQTRIPVILRLPAAAGLVCRDLLPATAERELSAIMAHKVDILTPWTVDQVHFDQRIEERRTDGQLEVSLVAAPRAAVAEARRRLAAIGIEARGVDLVEDDPWAAPTVDLLHATAPPRRRPRWVAPALAALMLAVAVGGVLLTQLILERQKLIGERRSHVGALEERLTDLPELRTTLEALRNETRFVAEQQRLAVSPLVVIEELTRLLPDTVWLSDLTLQSNTLTINGFADDAPAVVGLVEDSPVFAQAEFRSPSTRERVPLPDGSEREVSRFSLAARVEPLRTLDP
jgi:general secretion pathway protein L